MLSPWAVCCSLKVDSLVIKGPPQSRTASNFSQVPSFPELCKGPCEATGQLTASSHSVFPGSQWRAARRNKLETKDEVHILPGYAGSPGCRPKEETEPELESQSQPPYQAGSGLTVRSSRLILQAQRKVRLSLHRTRLLHCMFEIQLGQTGYGWRAEVSFLPGAAGLRSTLVTLRNQLWGIPSYIILHCFSDPAKYKQ